MIEDADRFGLAQLHQLRGGWAAARSPACACCSATPSRRTAPAAWRPSPRPTDGFRLAELDLEIRGTGSILGLRQAGPTDLRFARLSRDRRELAEARRPGGGCPRRPPPRPRPEHRLLREAVRARFAELPRLLDAEDRRRHPPRPPPPGPGGTATRPTADRVREAVFSIIGPVEGLDVLDLFAGSGALGLEALSRGAASASWSTARRGRRPSPAPTRRCSGMADRVRIVRRDWRSASPRSGPRAGSFGLCLLDPPYGLTDRVVAGVGAALAPS